MYDPEKRDALLKAKGVDVEAFRLWLREHDVSNECDTDEYRETQPSKGLLFVADYLADWGPGVNLCRNMIYLTLDWLGAYLAGDGPYAACEKLEPILQACFDYRWHLGAVGLYHDHSEPDDELIAFYKEEV